MLPGAIGNILGANMNQNALQWYQNALVNVLNQLTQANSTGLNNANASGEPLRNAATNLMNQGGQFVYGNAGSPGMLPGLQQELQGTVDALNPATFQRNALTPEQQQTVQALLGQAGAMQPLMQQGSANPDVANELGMRLTQLANGQGAQAAQSGTTGLQLLQAMGMNPTTTNWLNTANDVISNRGLTDALSHTTNGALGILGAGGFTPGLQGLEASGNGILNSAPLGVAGLTPTGATGEQVALGNLIRNGATPTSNTFEALGANLASRPALIPMDLAVSLARNNAATQVANAARNARTQAEARGGGPGSLVANGATNEALAEFGDQGAQAVANAVQQAIQGQQGLQLQQQQQGANMGLQGGGLQAENLNIAGNQLANLEGIANQRYGLGSGNVATSEQEATNRLLQAMGIIPSVQNTANNTVGTWGNLGLGTSQLAQGNLALGGNLLNNFNQTSLGGLQGLENLLGNQNQFTLGAANTAGNLYNSALSQGLAGGQLGLGQTEGYYGSLGNLYGQQGNLGSMGLQSLGMGMNPLLGLTQNWTGYAGNAIGGMPGIFHGYTPASPWGSFFQGLGG